jgi:hypothetical protein
MTNSDIAVSDRRLLDVTRLRAREVIEADTDAWSLEDWKHAAVMLASAIMAVTGDLRCEAE